MPTQEERLSALEKFQSIVAAHIRETEENTTILLGVIREYGRDIKKRPGYVKPGRFLYVLE